MNDVQRLCASGSIAQPVGSTSAKTATRGPNCGERLGPLSMVRNQMSNCSSFAKPVLLLAVLWLTAFLIGCGQPQIGESEEAFGEIDALYTAVTSKRKDLLEDCRKRITQLKSDGKLSPAAFKVVGAIMDEAAAERWSTAAPKLYDFMRAQRKDSSH